MFILLFCRYYAIVHPLAAMKLHSKSRTRKILAATWIVPMFVASPYLYCKSYPFNIWSTMGSISRQICTDRFDDIDGAISGDGATGYFRKGYFLFLFFIIYLVPLAVMVLTCVRIAICLLHPIVEKPDSAQGRRITRRREENKRRVIPSGFFAFHSFLSQTKFLQTYMMKKDLFAQKQSRYQIKSPETRLTSRFKHLNI